MFLQEFWEISLFFTNRITLGAWERLLPVSGMEAEFVSYFEAT